MTESDFELNFLLVKLAAEDNRERLLNLLLEQFTPDELVRLVNRLLEE